MKLELQLQAREPEMQVTEKDLQVKDAWLKYLHHATEAQKATEIPEPM